MSVIFLVIKIHIFFFFSRKKNKGEMKGINPFGGWEIYGW
jgi:hypothetical protein